MVSQCSPDSSFSSPLSLSLSKFSYATVPEDSNAPIPWTHLSNKGNLTAVFEKCRSWDHSGQLHDQSRFRVVNGTEIMEDLNLVTLAAEARKAIGQNQASNIPNRPSAVTIIIKKPCLAVRYPAGLGQIRRFQIRFSYDADYYAAMGRFSEANAPVTEAGTFSIPQPQPPNFSPSSSILYPSDSAIHLNPQPPSKPLVFPSQNLSSASKFDILSGNEGFVHPATSGSIVQGSTTTNQMPSAIISRVCDQKAETAICASSRDAPKPSTRLQREVSTSQYWNGSHGLMQISNQPDSECLPGRRPTSSHAWLAPVTSFSHEHINLYEPRPSTAPAIESQGLSDMLPPKRDLPFPKPVPRSGSKASKSTKYIAEPTSPVLSPKENDKISTSSSQPSNSQVLEMQPAPPTAKSKRAPAKKAPARVTKKLARPRARKKPTSVLEASPVPSMQKLLKRSQESAKAVTTISKTIDTQALLEQVEERQAFIARQNTVGKYILGPHVAQEAPGVVRQDSVEAPLAGARPTGEVAIDLAISEEPASHARTFTSITEVHDTQDHRIPSQAVPVLNQGTPPDCTATASSTPSMPQVLAEDPRSLAPTGCGPSVHPQDSPFTAPLASLSRDSDFAEWPNLAKWAQNPEEERRASLETLIFKSIHDENFFTLCKDLGGTWQRALLGGKI